RDSRKEIAPEISGEIGKTIVAERLDRPNDGRGVDVEQCGQLARGKKESLVRPFQHGLDQLVPPRTEAAAVLFRTHVEGKGGAGTHAATITCARFRLQQLL